MSTRNFDALFAPRSIVVIGAVGAGAGTGAPLVGDLVAANLKAAGFAGRIMKVGTDAGDFPSVEALPETPDLAVVATRAANVPGAVEALCERGCRAAAVISTGLSARSGDVTLRQRVLDVARPHLMRIVGPDCLGVISTAAGVNASLSPLMPAKGDIALVSQSGAIANAVLDWADQKGIGFSHAISLGDMADVDFGDLLDFLATDRATRSILLYVESVTSAKKFMSAARIAARSKPVIAIKAGHSPAGARATLSHTGALAGEDQVYEAAFRRAGLLRVRTIEELVEAATTLSTGMRISGDRLSILTNAGGAGILAVDALESLGGHLAEFDERTCKRLAAALPADRACANPVDIGDDADAARYEETLRALLDARATDAILVIDCPTAAADRLAAAKAVVRAKREHPRFPILTSWLGGASAVTARRLLSEHRIATYENPDDAVRAFTHLTDYRRNQELLLETPSTGADIDPSAVDGARALIAKAREEGRRILSEGEAKRLLGFFGIASVATLSVADPAEAGRRFTEVGAPAVLKIVSPDIVHKSDVGGVRLDLQSAEETVKAGEAMISALKAAAPEARVLGFTLQPMVRRSAGYELIVGTATDATFGPVVLFGQGGKGTELIRDRAIGLPPLNSALAEQMIRSTSISRMLEGFRDVPAVPIGVLAEVLVRLSELAVLIPEIAELDINPLLTDADGAIALDARVALKDLAEPPTGPAIRPYPREFERRLTLRDGSSFKLRPIRPEDETALADMVLRCTPDDLRLRFMGPMRTLPHQTAARFSQIDYDREMAFVAVDETRRRGAKTIYGVVRLVCDPENEAGEFAVLVRSDLKGKGLGRELMANILDYGRKRGLSRVYGEVLRENTTMLAVARALGFRPQADASDFEVAHVTIELGEAATAG